MIPHIQKEKLIDELVSENSDATIKDYLGWLAEFDHIAEGVVKKATRQEIIKMILSGEDIQLTLKKSA